MKYEELVETFTWKFFNRIYRSIVFVCDFLPFVFVGYYQDVTLSLSFASVAAGYHLTKIVQKKIDAPRPRARHKGPGMPSSTSTSMTMHFAMCVECYRHFVGISDLPFARSSAFATCCVGNVVKVMDGRHTIGQTVAGLFWGFFYSTYMTQYVIDFSVKYVEPNLYLKIPIWGVLLYLLQDFARNLIYRRYILQDPTIQG